MNRREFVKATVAFGVSAGIWTRASAQTASWPNRPVRLVVPYPPGGASDIVARPWAAALSEAFGQQFIIDNRGGAAGSIGCQAVASAAADGYTFLLTPSGTLSLLPLLRKTPYDPQKSFTPVGRTGDIFSGFVINPAVGPKTIKETVEYAKANPRKLAYGSAGNGSITHLRIEMLKYRAGIDILHVPYRGSSEALTDLLGNRIQMMSDINTLPHVKDGNLTLLCLNYPTRSEEFPNTPTLTEAGYPDSDCVSWFSVMAPAATPPEIIAKFNAKLAEIGNTETMKNTMQRISGVSKTDTPEGTAQFLADELQRNAVVIKAANITLE